MTRKLARLCCLFALAIPVWAGSNSGSISGQVKNSAGEPQMGATVELFSSASTPAAKVFTDARGFYKIDNLANGIYEVKVTAPSFLPYLRQNISLRSGAAMVINVTVNTLFEAIQVVPISRRSTDDNEEDWKWTLRSMSNRPILRVLDDGPVVVSRSERDDDRVLRARVAFIAGAEAEGLAGTAGSTIFDIEHSIFSSGVLSFNGNLAYNGQSAPATIVRTSYRQQLPNGSTPELGLTARRFAMPRVGPHSDTLQALALSASDTFTLFDFAELKLGAEFQTLQYLGRASDLKPFGSLDMRFGPNTGLAYRYSTFQPTTRQAKGYDTAPPDLSESGPRMSISNFQPLIEDARHHEVALSRRLGPKTAFEVALFRDDFSNPSLMGVGDVSTATGNFLPDIYSGTFAYTGRDFSTSGIRLVGQRKLTSDLTATLDYSWGGTLTINPNAFVENVRTHMRTVRRHAISGKVSGEVPVTHTRWIASYKWTSGPALVSIDSFNASPGQADPYLNIFLRQPVPSMGFLPKMEALVDVRNLLAEGYVPVIGNDGRTLYLVQSARAVRGGVAFTF